ncbi:hypothetical protein GYB59_17555 [bacterium]|nr:hypothetical protein [bacterium]
MAGDIRFIMESSGVSVDQGIDYDDQSMDIVEQFYRYAAKQPSSIEFGIDNFERLLSLYLGQSLVEREAGEWVQYEGKHHVVFPVVMRLGVGQHVDVFLFCKSLHQKQVSGSQDGHALVKFIETANKMAFP